MLPGETYRKVSQTCCPESYAEAEQADMTIEEKYTKTKVGKKVMSGPLGKLIKQVISFGIIGIFNTLLGILLIELFYNIFHWNYWVSSITSYVIGSIYSFFANKKLTFRMEGRTGGTAIRFAVNTAICYGIAYGVAKPLVKMILADMPQRVVENVALLVGMGLFIVMNFFGQKFFVFKELEGKARQGEDSIEKAK